MTKKQEVTHYYYNVKKINSELLIEFGKLQEFMRFVERNKLRDIFLLQNDVDSITHFAVAHKGGLLIQPTQDYQSLQDVQLAREQGYPDASTFYQGQAQAYKNYEEYTKADESGVADKASFDQLKQDGFIDGYTSYKNNTAFQALFGKIKTATDLAAKAKEAGFDTYPQLQQMLDGGFENKTDYDIAAEKGFNNAQDYFLACEKGFLNYTEFTNAKNLNIDSRADFHRYLDLQILQNKAEYDDQRVLLNMLSKLPQGKKVSINKIHSLLQEAYQEYWLEADAPAMPPWFTIGFATEQAVVDFITTSDTIKEFGQYHTDGEYFETIKIQDRDVVLDGSNVAHNSLGKKDSKPTVANMVLMVQELKKRGFETIKIISDASLRHKLKDTAGLKKLKELCEYIESPSDTTADLFIIRYVKHHHCLLVSNDTFREWKMQDPWVANNVDFYRLSFMITGNTVLLPDLE